MIVDVVCSSTYSTFLDNEVKINPSPFVDRLLVESLNNSIKIEKIDLVDYTGKVLSTKKIEPSREVNWDIGTAIPPSFYIVHIHTNKGVIGKKVLKVN